MTLLLRVLAWVCLLLAVGPAITHDYEAAFCLVLASCVFRISADMWTES